MHGSTARMVEHLVDRLSARGLKVIPFDLSVTDIGKLAIALVDAATIIIGSPTVHVGPHPMASYAAGLAGSLRPKAKFASIIGSYGWSTRMVETISGLLQNLKLDIIAPVLCKGLPRAKDFVALDDMANAIAAKHESMLLK